MSVENSACKPVATGGVGESGASSLLSHTVTAKIQKLMVLRTVESSLCPNTGAVGLIAINGVPVATGAMGAKGNTLQAEVRPGDHVAAVVHTVPLFNGVLCVRLGEASVTLDECDFVGLAGDHSRDSGLLSGCPLASKDWFAWNDLMPPKPDAFHVVGEVQVGNPGVEVLLVPRTPQGINPQILLMDLLLIQRPGIWPQLVVWKSVRYDKVNSTYRQVQIFCGADLVADVPVVDVQ